MRLNFERFTYAQASLDGGDGAAAATDQLNSLEQQVAVSQEKLEQLLAGGWWTTAWCKVEMIEGEKSVPVYLYIVATDLGESAPRAYVSNIIQPNTSNLGLPSWSEKKLQITNTELPVFDHLAGSFEFMNFEGDPHEAEPLDMVRFSRMERLLKPEHRTDQKEIVLTTLEVLQGLVMARRAVAPLSDDRLEYCFPIIVKNILQGIGYYSPNVYITHFESREKLVESSEERFVEIVLELLHKFVAGDKRLRQDTELIERFPFLYQDAVAEGKQNLKGEKNNLLFIFLIWLATWISEFRGQSLNEEEPPSIREELNDCTRTMIAILQSHDKPRLQTEIKTPESPKRKDNHTVELKRVVSAAEINELILHDIACKELVIRFQQKKPKAETDYSYAEDTASNDSVTIRFTCSYTGLPKSSVYEAARKHNSFKPEYTFTGKGQLTFNFFEAPDVAWLEQLKLEGFDIDKIEVIWSVRHPEKAHPLKVFADAQTVVVKGADGLSADIVLVSDATSVDISSLAMANIAGSRIENLTVRGTPGVSTKLVVGQTCQDLIVKNFAECYLLSDVGNLIVQTVARLEVKSVQKSIQASNSNLHIYKYEGTTDDISHATLHTCRGSLYVLLGEVAEAIREKTPATKRGNWSIGSTYRPTN